MRKFKEYVTEVRALVWSPSDEWIGFTLATRESDGMTDVVNVHEVSSGRLIYQLTGPANHVFDLHWAPGGRIRAVAGDGSTVQVWEWTLSAGTTM